jgi:ABC-2 type transport system ATP-binding protein
VLFSSHQLTDVEKVCDRVVIIHRGRIAFDDHLSTFATGATTVVVEVKANPDAAAQQFRTLPGVDDATAAAAGDGWTAVSVRSKHDQDVREAVAMKAFEKGWGVRRLEVKRDKLEDTFMRVAYQRA